MLEIIGNNKHIDFLTDVIDVMFVDAPTGRNKFLLIGENCHVDAIQLKRCLDEMSNESAVFLPYVIFSSVKETGHYLYDKMFGKQLNEYTDIGLYEINNSPKQNIHNVIYNPCADTNIVKEFHCDYVLLYEKD